MKLTVSIIIVHYHVKEELFNCIQSIIASKPKISYEIIIVDNDEKKTIKKDLIKKFPKVIYIPNENKGFGQGNNVGSKKAHGEYLFFLNPDTIVFKETIEILVNFLQKHTKAGVVAPFLLHENKKPFEQQGVKTLTPLRGIFTFSFINKLFPKNPISQNYFLKWDRIKCQEVDVVPGTAFMMKRDLFAKLHGFDENFFLYFEEFDLCKRIKEQGYRLFIEPKAKIVHLWERSTKQRNDISKIFKESRFYYFKKHYGILTALLTESIIRIGKYTVLFWLVLLLAIVLRIYRLNELMAFIGDQGWFYLSARDMILMGHVPLVGITSSHIWLHQGPYWTYMLAGALFLGHFNPISGAYLTVTIGLLTALLLYKFGSEMYSQRIGLLSALFYTTSPLILLSDRLAYHTSPIAFLTLILFYILYKWTNGYKYGFPLTVFMLTMLYNFETATFMLVPLVVLIVIFGLFRKYKWAKDNFKLKLLFLSAVSWIIVMIPMLLYDVSNGYPQTFKFLEWLIYKIATIFGYPHLHPGPIGESFQTMTTFATIQVQQFFFLDNAFIAWFIFGVIIVSLFVKNKSFFDKKEYLQPYSLLLLFFIVPTIGYIVEKTNSSAYLILFFPTISFMFAIFMDQMISLRKFFYPTLALLILYLFINIYSLVHSNFLTGDGITFVKRLDAAKYIISQAKGRQYNLIGRGEGSEYISFTMDYEYLAWWLGHGPVHMEKPLQFIIQENPTGIVITKQMILNK